MLLWLLLELELELELEFRPNVRVIRACDSFIVLSFMFNLMVSARVGVIVLIIGVNRVSFAFSVSVCDLTVSPPPPPCAEPV